MLLTYARAFTVAAASVEYSRGQVNGLLLTHQFDPVTNASPVGISVIGALATLRDLCASIPSLNPVVHQIERTTHRLATGILPLVLNTELEGLQLRVMDELRNHFYFPVTAANAQLYENPMPYGETVYEAFPSARDDLVDAARCLIFSQPTAAAFHLMRVLEVALKCFAKKLKIDYGSSWDAYFRAIEGKLNRPYKDKTRPELKAEPEQRAILGDLMAVKLAWRNPTMHIERRYADHEALQVFVTASMLLERMANAGIRERLKQAAALLPDNSLSVDAPISGSEADT